MTNLAFLTNWIPEVSKEIHIAMISAVSASLVAFIGIISVVKSNKEQRRTQNEVENLKKAINIEAERRKKSENTLREKMEHAREATSLMQNCRDILAELVEAGTVVLSFEDAIEKLDDLESRISKNYQIVYSIDSGQHVECLHAAKGVIKIVNKIIKTEYLGSNKKELDPKIKEMIEGERARLKNMQEIVRDKHLSLMHEYITC